MSESEPICLRKKAGFQNFLTCITALAGRFSELGHTLNKCLCALCHANQDEHHQRNFTKRRLKKNLEFFIDEYIDELKNVGNRYIEVFLMEQNE